ncbi:hypothetical protein KM043_000380 [Ampulex compressa]|nr:hypothetical protein KM043_000380 [Ampulex compressa]
MAEEGEEGEEPSRGDETRPGRIGADLPGALYSVAPLRPDVPGASPSALSSSLDLWLKLFRKVVAARVPYYGQQVLPHSNLLDPHLRSQFAGCFVFARRKAQRSAPFDECLPFAPRFAARL